MAVECRFNCTKYKIGAKKWSILIVELVLFNITSSVGSIFHAEQFFPCICRRVWSFLHQDIPFYGESCVEMLLGPYFLNYSQWEKKILLELNGLYVFNDFEPKYLFRISKWHLNKLTYLETNLWYKSNTNSTWIQNISINIRMHMPFSQLLRLYP